MSLMIYLQHLQGFCAQLVLFLIILNYSLPLASKLICYGARLASYFCLYQGLGKCQLLNLFTVFPAIQQLWASSPPDNMTLYPINRLCTLPIRRLIRVLLFRLALVQLHVLLWIQQLISHTRTVLVNTIASLQDSDFKVIPVSEVHELLTKINDILDNAIAKQVGNTAHI